MSNFNLFNVYMKEDLLSEVIKLFKFHNQNNEYVLIIYISLECLTYGVRYCKESDIDYFLPAVKCQSYKQDAKAFDNSDIESLKVFIK